LEIELHTIFSFKKSSIQKTVAFKNTFSEISTVLKKYSVIQFMYKHSQLEIVLQTTKLPLRFPNHNNLVNFSTFHLCLHHSTMQIFLFPKIDFQKFQKKIILYGEKDKVNTNSTLYFLVQQPIKTQR